MDIFFDGRTRRYIFRLFLEGYVQRSSRSITLAIVALLVVVGAAGLFVADAGSAEHEPVNFDYTVSMGLSLEEEFALDGDVQLPQTQVFYSQYQYVVGYYGVETFVEAQKQDGHEQRFGYPLTIHVTDYSGTNVELTEDGYPASDTVASWTDAETAVYVLDSEAQTPRGETVMPFSDRSDAEAFTDEYGGEIVTWEEVLETNFGVDDAEVVRDRVDDHHAWADDRVADTRTYLDRSERPVSMTVGEDTETIQEAVDQAPENTTVLVPEGTYEERVEVDRPITLAGENATIDGEGNGTVVTLSADRAAVVGFDVDGVGGSLREDDVDVDGDVHAHDTDDVPDDWEEAVEAEYGNADSGVEARNATGALIEDVQIDTPSNGVFLNESPDSVVRDVTIEGADQWRSGFMGVLTMYSPSVIEESTIVDGRDNVYSHQSDGLVIRNNTLSEGRFGIHFMHTSDSTIAGNEVTNQDRVGMYVMTGPERNAIVDNHVRDNPTGIIPGGDDSYVAGNLVENNGIGIRGDTSATIYENNVFAGNVEGMNAEAILPTNRIADNDFVGNAQHADTTFGPLRIFTHDGVGNYWHGSIGEPTGEALDRSYSPTDAVDQRLHYVDGTPTLARSSALDVVSGLEASVPGARTGSIVDTAPLCEPANPDLLAQSEWEEVVGETNCDTNTTP